MSPSSNVSWSLVIVVCSNLSNLENLIRIVYIKIHKTVKESSIVYGCFWLLSPERLRGCRNFRFSLLIDASKYVNIRAIPKTIIIITFLYCNNQTIKITSLGSCTICGFRQTVIPPLPVYFNFHFMFVRMGGWWGREKSQITCVSVQS